MTHRSNTPDTELAHSFQLVTTLSLVLEAEARFLEDLKLKTSLFLAEVCGEVISSAPPPWMVAA